MIGAGGIPRGTGRSWSILSVISVVDVLEDRSVESASSWLQERPIEVVSRDRCGLYAQAAREGAPQARHGRGAHRIRQATRSQLADPTRGKFADISFWRLRDILRSQAIGRLHLLQIDALVSFCGIPMRYPTVRPGASRWTKPNSPLCPPLLSWRFSHPIPNYVS
jgi:hypothetical protein